MCFAYLIFRLLLDEIDIGDSITQNDLVTRQYEALPYPPVSNDDISKEEEFYSNKHQSKLIYSYPTITLENLNHFLLRGNENFRQV